MVLLVAFVGGVGIGGNGGGGVDIGGLVVVVVVVLVVLMAIYGGVGGHHGGTSGVCGRCWWWCWYNISPKRKESESRSTSDNLTKKAKVQRDSEELPEQSHSGKNIEEGYNNDVVRGRQGFVDGNEENKSEEEEKKYKQEEEGEKSEKEDANASLMGHELISKSQHEVVKTISTNRFQVAMTIVDPAELTGPHFLFPNEHGVWSSQAQDQAWAFESIPLSKSRSRITQMRFYHPRILRWLAAKSNIRIKEAGLFNPQDDAVVHPWIMPTEQDLGMTSFITLGLVDTISDPTVELIKKELAGETAIRRVVRQGHPNVEALHDQPTTTDLGTSSRGVARGIIDVGSRHADAAASLDDEYVDAQYIEEILCLTRDKQLTCPQAYDVVDSIMDLNFYKNFKYRYDNLSKLPLTAGGPGFDLLVSGF
ncbi:hypothetical protein FXO37_29744 [Capsicum annuum]|nr:hypothetical protein FXO37_29744 [Capsicum annuum]